MTVVFHDHFSGHAADYAAHRPTYPDALFDHLASLAPTRRVAWDCGAGNGQAARAVARRFERVVATDGSREQLASGAPDPRLQRCVALAERAPLGEARVDLVTVAQAAHWFDLDRFYREVARVARPGGVLALWCYGPTRVSSAVDAITDRFHDEIVGPHWPPERRFVNEGYRTLAFPFDELRAPAFEIRRSLTLDGFLGYLGTWSASRRFAAGRGRDPRHEIAGALAAAWPDPDGGPVPGRWPIGLRLGRVDGAGA